MPMPEPLQFVIAGDSHIFAMGAAQNFQGPPELVRLQPPDDNGYFLMEEWRGLRSDSYWQKLNEYTRARVAILQVMGNQHFGNFLLARPQLFDVVDAGDTGGEVFPSAHLAPRRMVKDLPLFRGDRVRAIINDLHASGCAQVIVCGTPPVRDDYTDQEESVRTSGFFQARARELGIDIATCRFTPAPIMKRLWGVLQECLADIAQATHSLFLAVPAQSIDGNGYLAEQFRGPLANFTHPNNAYGLSMLKEIVRAVRALERDRLASLGNHDGRHSSNLARGRSIQ
jgi:hypothetical protein